MKVSKVLAELDGGKCLEHLILSGELYHTKDRCTGKSTGYVLEMIGKAMQNPERAYKLQEHPTYHMNRHLIGMAHSLITLMGLKYFVIGRTNNTIEYRPFATLKINISVEDI